ALFQGWYCPNDSAVSVRTAATMRLKRNTCCMTYLSGYWGGEAPSVCGPMAMSVSPFTSRTLTILPTGAPFFTGCNATVTGSPALKEVRRQPREDMVVGFWVSTDQLRTAPVSSFASNFRKQWGFAQIHSVTVPFSVSSLSVSKVAAP